MADDLVLLTKRMQWNARPVSGAPNYTEFHVGWVNYYDSSKKWAPIECLLSSLPTGFEVTNSPFYFKAPKRSTGYAEMISNNRFDLFEKTEITAPEFSQTIKCLGINDVAGQLLDINVNGRLDAVLYPAAYTASFQGDLIYFPEHGRAPRLKKLVRFNNAPVTDINIEFEIEYSGPNKPELSPRDIPQGYSRETWCNKWDADFSNDPNNTLLRLDDNGGCYVRARDTQKRGLGIKKTYIWDSSVDPITGQPKIWTVESYIKWISGNKYKLVKVIPKAFFVAAVFPVYTDTTSTFYPDPHPETSSVDGRIIYTSGTGESWATVHAKTDGNAVFDDAASGAMVYSGKTAGVGEWAIDRGVFLYDTSSIPDTDTISSGLFSLYLNSIFNDDPDGNDFMRLVQSSPASNTALINADFDQVGAVVDPTAGAGDVDLDDMTLDQYNIWTMNATGLGWIDKTGITKLGVRDGHDAVNDEPDFVASEFTRIGGRWADFVGTDFDPKLVIVHAGGSISRYHSLDGLGGQGQMTTNPLG